MSDSKHKTNEEPVVADDSKKQDGELEQLKKELEEAQNKAEEYKSKYLRALADYQNFEKRVADQRIELVKGANQELILKLLGFLDNLEKAEAFVKDPNLKLVKESFYKTLESTGLKEIDMIGREFDPYTAEVIDLVEGDKDNIVTEVLRKGYELNGKVIRIAQVKVSKKKAINN